MGRKVGARAAATLLSRPSGFRMPCGPSLHAGQDWEPVVLRKNGPIGKAAKSGAEVNKVRRKGEAVETDKI